jgi:predicted homoserine dehydrogenase-like protein
MEVSRSSPTEPSITRAQRTRQIGIDDPVVVETAAELSAALSAGRPAICEDPALVTEAEPIECVVEATGDDRVRVPHRRSSAIDHGKHLVLLNAELDCTLGPLLKQKCRCRAGVVFTDATATSRVCC